MKRRGTGRGKRAVAVLAAAGLSMVLTACGHKSDISAGPGNTETEEESGGHSEQSLMGAGTEAEEIFEYPETETEEETEPLSEYIVEAETELVYSGLIYSLDEKEAQWAQNFDVNRVKDLVYITKGEDEAAYTVEDPDVIQQFFDAIMQIEIASAVGTPVREAGDMFVFEMRDGENMTFKFSMGSILLGDRMYETNNTGMLWELTGNLIEPETDQTVLSG